MVNSGVNLKLPYPPRSLQGLTLGHVIRQEAALSGMSLRELGRRAGMTWESLWPLTRDQVKDPKLRYLDALSRVLDLPLDALVAAALSRSDDGTSGADS